MNNSNKTDYVTSKTERASYYSYWIGQNIIYMLVTTYISTYFVWKLGIAAASVGTILLIARVWDAANDPMLSILVEKANLKGGKFKPWINSVAILVPVMTVLLFSFSNILADSSTAVKLAYASIAYVLWGMLYTISDAPAFALATVMTSNPGERDTLISFARTFAFVGVFFAMVATMPLVDVTSWFVAALIMAAIAMALMLQIRRTKERVEHSRQSPSLKEILRAIFTNKYLLIIVICLVFQMGSNFAMTIMPMVALDIFGDANLTSLLMIGAMLPMIAIIPFTPMLVKKFGKITLYKFGTITTIALSAATYIAGYDSFGVFMGLTVARSLLMGTSMIVPTLFFADCVEYYFYKTGERYEAAIFSAQTFANKALGAVAGAGGMWILAAYGYIEGEGIVQTQRVVDGMWMAFNIGPAVGSLIAVIIFWIAYDLSEKKLTEMKAD